MWTAADLGRRQALEVGYSFVAMGTSEESIAESRRLFETRGRVEWRLR